MSTMDISTTVFHTDAGPASVTVSRRDRGTILKPVRTPEGFIMAEGVAAIAGVYPYYSRDENGKVHKRLELIDTDELLDASSLGTLSRATLTLTHPSEDGVSVRVSSQNVQKFLVGDVSEEVESVQEENGGFARIKLVIRRADAVDAVDDGTQELSCGYDCTVVMKPGVHPEFGPYDGRQTKRVYNHLAIVPKGRHGAEASLSMDAAPVGVGIQWDSTDPPPPTNPGAPLPSPPREDRMDPALLMLAQALKVQRGDGMSDEQFTLAILDAASKLGSAATTINQLKGDLAAMTTARDTAQASLTEMTTSRDTLQGKNDVLTTKVDAMEKAEKARVDAEDRVGLLAKAKSLKLTVADDATNQQIRFQMAKSRVDSLPDDASADRIQGILDTISIPADESREDTRFKGFKPTKPTKPATPREDGKPHEDGLDPWTRQQNQAYTDSFKEGASS